MIRVRDSFPKLSYLPIISNSRDSDTDLCDVIDFNTPSVSQSFDENVLLVDPKSFKPPDTLSKKDDENIPTIEPIVKISSLTPLKKIYKNNAIAIAKTNVKEQHITVKNKRKKNTIKKIDSCKELEFLDIPLKNSIMPYDRSGDGKVYSRKTCPFHKHEPAMKIFDDDIEKYLTDNLRASISLEQKLIKLPLQNASKKYDKVKSKITSAKKIKGYTSPRKKLKYYSDNVIDLTASEIGKIAFKEDDILNKQHELESDFLISDFKFSLNKKSRKETKTVTKEVKTVSSFPKFQSGIKILSDELKIKCPELQKHLSIPKTREKLIDESK